MRLAIFKGEKTVTDLANRLFPIQGDGSQAATRQAADTLLKANPQLKDISNVRVGALITIPDTAPPMTAGEEVTSAALVRSFVAQSVKVALNSLQQQLSNIETSTVAELEPAIRRFQTPEVKAALKTASGAKFMLPGFAPSPDAASKDAMKLLKNIKTAQNARKKVVTKLQAALASFAK